MLQQKHSSKAPYSRWSLRHFGNRSLRSLVIANALLRKSLASPCLCASFSLRSLGTSPIDRLPIVSKLPSVRLRASCSFHSLRHFGNRSFRSLVIANATFGVACIPLPSCFILIFNFFRYLIQYSLI